MATSKLNKKMGLKIEFRRLGGHNTQNRKEVNEFKTRETSLTILGVLFYVVKIYLCGVDDAEWMR